MANRYFKSGPPAHEDSGDAARLGSWEKHTRGIGSKLLLKMGYEPGKGLGKHGDGIVEPIIATANKGRRSLGVDADRVKTKAKDRSKSKIHCNVDYSSSSPSSSASSRSSSPEIVEQEDLMTIINRLERTHMDLIEKAEREISVEERRRKDLTSEVERFEEEIEVKLSYIKRLESFNTIVNDLALLDKKDLKSFWKAMNYLYNIRDYLKDQFIQVFALPILQERHRLLEKKPLNVLDDLVFAEWIRVLKAWLMTQPDYEMVISWYLEWKNRLSPIIDTKTVKYFKRRALDLMYIAVTRPEELQSYEYIPYQDQPRAEEKNDAPFTRELSGMNFKEMIEDRANNRGLLFKPIVGKTQENKQVYQFGRTRIYLDNKVIYYLDRGRWFPITINDLIGISNG